jgi:hypothetical protein
MSKIFDVQQHIVDILNADPYFNDPDPTKVVLAMSQRKGNVAQEVQIALTRAGVGVIVMLPLMIWEGEADRSTLGLRFAVVVTENPMVNQSPKGTGKPAEALVEKAIKLIHWKPQAANMNPRNVSSLYRVDRNAVRMMPPAPGAQALLNYFISVNTSITL